MRIEELEAIRHKAYAHLIDSVACRGTASTEAYQHALDLVDDALQDAIRQLKIHRDRDQNSMASRYG
jgi:hypothetical protein